MKKHMPKTLLINPPGTGALETLLEMVTEPLGIAYIAGVLEREEYPVEILDALALAPHQRERLADGRFRVGLSEDQIARHVQEFKPDIVGIACMFSAYAPDSHRIARCIKQACPNVTIVFGGAHTSVAPDMVMNDKNVDLAVVGEGEMTFLEIVRGIEEGKDCSRIKGTVARGEDGAIIHNEPRELIKNLDELPFPARHLLPMESYLEFQRKSGTMYRYSMRKPICTLISSRGCPNNCIFCAVRNVWGRTWRARSPEKVVEEIKLLVDRYGIGEFAIIDDNISVKKERLIKICQGLIETDLDLKWTTPNGIYLPSLDEEVLGYMARCGYYRATFGIESGYEETRKFIRKNMNIDKVREVICTCHKLGIWTNSTFIIGFPDEKIESIRATMRMPIDLELDSAAFNIAQPYVGTDLLDIFNKYGLMKDGILESSTIYCSNYDTNYFTHEELMKLVDQAYTRLFIHRALSVLNPLYLSRLLRKINSPEKFAYFLRLIRNVIRGTRPGRSSIWKWFSGNGIALERKVSNAS